MGAPASNCSAEERDIETNGDLNINELQIFKLKFFPRGNFPGFTSS